MVKELHTYNFQKVLLHKMDIVPMAYLEAKAQQVKAEANALSIVTKMASEAAAKEFGHENFNR